MENDVAQLDRVFIADGEYVRADTAIQTVDDLRAEIAHLRATIADDAAALEAADKGLTERSQEIARLTAERDGLLEWQRARLEIHDMLNAEIARLTADLKSWQDTAESYARVIDERDVWIVKAERERDEARAALYEIGMAFESDNWTEAVASKMHLVNAALRNEQ